MQLLSTPLAELSLSRFPLLKKDLLRAWDAADEFLINWFFENYSDSEKLNILIINDSFGALATSLAEHNLTIWTDSYLTEQGIGMNFKQNNISMDKLKIIHSTELPQGKFDLILIKIPRSLAMLEDQLCRIQPILNSEAKITSSGMVKVIHTSTLTLFENIIGSTKTSLAKKKARLIFSNPDVNKPKMLTKYPKDYVLDNTNYHIINHANVFSRDSLDVGTRFFLQYIPSSEKFKSIVDLGCGNGILGLIAAEKNSSAEITFIDESFMAVLSAQETFLRAFENTRKVNFISNDGLTGIKQDSVDLILNNPPFHQQNAVVDDVAWRMFKQSKNVLKLNGELWVIGNRHLAYHIKLKKIFGNCETIASNNKFVILKAIKD